MHVGLPPLFEKATKHLIYGPWRSRGSINPFPYFGRIQSQVPYFVKIQSQVHSLFEAGECHNLIASLFPQFGMKIRKPLRLLLAQCIFCCCWLLLKSLTIGLKDLKGQNQIVCCFKQRIVNTFSCLSVADTMLRLLLVICYHFDWVATFFYIVTKLHQVCHCQWFMAIVSFLSIIFVFC